MNPRFVSQLLGGLGSSDFRVGLKLALSRDMGLFTTLTGIQIPAKKEAAA